MYRVNELQDMTISKLDPLYYDITLSIQRQEDVPDEEGLLKVKSIVHLITKHPKEIKQFMKYLMKRAKTFKTYHLELHYQNSQLANDQNFINTLFNQHTTKFIFDLNSDRATKGIANLADLRQGLCCSISILNIINENNLWMDEEIVNFFETNVHNILKQGFILKQAGGRPSKAQWPMNFSKKWFILTNQFLCYVKKPFPPEILTNSTTSNNKALSQDISKIQTTGREEMFQLKEVLLIDNLWEVTVKKGLNKTKIKIRTNNRILSLKFYEYNFKSWDHQINYAMLHSPWSAKLERFVDSSFAPLRNRNSVKLMIDGEMFFRNVAEEIKKAQFEIFITDWWLCPKYYLVRPVSLDNKDDKDNYRLDKLLLRAVIFFLFQLIIQAERGVQIYILHWRESKFAVNFNSLITKKYLMGLHPNIKMARHSSGAIQLWSHHAKLVVIDQMIAFVGGMDICYGRWDTRNHALFDISNSQQEKCLFPGNDYCNEKQKPMNKTEDHKFCTLEREKEVRMPFHDTAICIEGDVANDFSHHFVHLWNNAKLDKHGKSGKVASITTHTKYRGFFRKVFKKMQPTASTGVVSMGYREREDRQRELEVIKKLKTKNLQRAQTDLLEKQKYQISEDEKFDEGLEGIMTKNFNLQNYQEMQQRLQSPKKLQNLNSTNKLGEKIQSLFGMRTRQMPQQAVQKSNFIESQTPKDSSRSDQQDYPPRTSSRVQPLFETPNKQVPLQRVSQFEKSPQLIPNYGHQQTIEHLNSQQSLNKIEEEGQENLDSALQEAGVIIQQKSNTIPFAPLAANIQLDNQSAQELKDYIEDEEKKQLERDIQEEQRIDQEQKLNKLRKYHTVDHVSPYLKTEEVQILMHSPFGGKIEEYFKRRLKEKGEEEKDVLPQFDGETPQKRELIAKFHSGGRSTVDHTMDHHVYHNCTIQALRSASQWSLGLLKVEHSIYEGYIQLIEQSQKFIYIENQFFITQSILYERNKRNIVKNKIGLALRERILRAHRHNESFFVIVFVPILPAFSGDILESSSSILRIQVNYQMKSMAKGKNSLIELLRQDGIQDPWQYIKFFSLRNHSLMQPENIPKTEMIYIHSKAMIVDDQYLIIGSANINDRSMLGSRDHEIGVILSQNDPEDQIEVPFDGKFLKVSKSVHTFRTQLMMEHFGLQYEEVRDPILARDRVRQVAQTNTKMYQEIFRCEPDDSISTFDQLVRLRELRKLEQDDVESFKSKYIALSTQIVGHAVNYPVFFLKDERLGQNFLNSEILVPEITFV